MLFSDGSIGPRSFPLRNRRPPHHASSSEHFSFIITFPLSLGCFRCLYTTALSIPLFLCFSRDSKSFAFLSPLLLSVHIYCTSTRTVLVRIWLFQQRHHLSELSCLAHFLVFYSTNSIFTIYIMICQPLLNHSYTIHIYFVTFPPPLGSVLLVASSGAVLSLHGALQLHPGDDGAHHRLLLLSLGFLHRLVDALPVSLPRPLSARRLHPAEHTRH